MEITVEKAICSKCAEAIEIDESVKFTGTALLKGRKKKGSTYVGDFELIDTRILCQVCQAEEETDQKT